MLAFDELSSASEHLPFAVTTEANAAGLCNGTEGCAGARAGVMDVHHAEGESSVQRGPSQETAPNRLPKLTRCDT